MHRASVVAFVAVVLSFAPPMARADEAHVKELERQAAKIRGLEWKSAVKVEWRTKAELGDRLEVMFARDMPDAEIEAAERLLIHLDLIAKGSDLKKTMLDMLRENIAGFYDPKDKILWIIKDEAAQSPDDDIVVIHELIHALEDQHFDLLAHDAKVKGHDDRMLALSGLVEGSATYGMFQPMLQQSGANDRTAREFMVRGMSLVLDVSGSLQPSADAPDFLMGSLIYPYASGLDFVGAQLRNGDYTVVGRLYDSPPASTEQVLHPEKYARATRDDPVEVKLPDLTGALGQGWTLVVENTMGELQTRLAFREWLVDRPASGIIDALPEDARPLGKLAARLGSRLVRALDPNRVAEGWGGDRYALHAHEDGRTAFVWRSTWDTEDEAAEFESAYRRAARLRNLHRRDAYAERNGRDVTILELVPESSREAVLKALSGESAPKSRASEGL